MASEPSYTQKLAQEAELWGSEAEKQAGQIPPDWRYHRYLRHNIIMHAADIEGLLAWVQPGMRVIELGCASGWLTLAMAERGAWATGLDISEKSLNVARMYYEQVKSRVSGSVDYQAADLNALELPPDTFDIVAVKASLHHLIEMEHVIGQIHRTLKSGGLLWVVDTLGDEALASVLIAGGLCFFLPTETPYADKLRALFKFGLRAPSRVRASIQAEGLSPFEGAGREHDWVKLVEQRFTIEKRVDSPAFTGYVTAQLKAPDRFAIPFLKLLRAIDGALVRLKLLRNTGVILYARK